MKNVTEDPRARAVFIVLLALIVYLPAVTSGFIWDDDVMLTENEVMTASDGLHRIWFSTELSDYFPLTSTSFWLEWRLWGLNPIGYNVTNILLHALSGLLLWRVLLRLGIPGSWLAAVLFTIHPVCAASVDWIAQRKNTLSMVFYMATLLACFRFERNGQKSNYATALVLFLLALLSKTSVVVLPPVLLLCAWWQRGAIAKRDVIRSLPFFALALLLGLVTVWFQLHERFVGEMSETDTMLTRVLGGSWAIWFYLGKVILPLNLSIVYSPLKIDPAQIISYVPAVLWVCVLVAAWKARTTWGRPLLFGLGYFTIALGPVLGFFDMDFLLISQVADHLQYLALPGAIALVVGVSVVLWQRFIEKNCAERKWISGTVAGISIVILAGLTWKQSCTYVNAETLWSHAVAKNPGSWMAHHQLADRMAELGRYDEATVHYRKSLELRPDFANGQNNFGNCLFLLGDIESAIEQFLDAIQNKPELAEAHNNLGVAYYQKGAYQEALDAYKKAFRLRPNYVAAYFGAGNSELQMANLQGALNYYFAATKYNPYAADIHYNIGIVLGLQGNTNAAVASLQTALEIDPDHQLAQQEMHLLAGDASSEKAD
ncbi:MAG: tetratricopeptide repeat protein [Verrucomicrobia bacterium]|nr:tetratricopeptide repeat protein [Verrucomicrobiota bacterium]